MIKHVKLFTPGPGDVSEDVLEALATPVLRHYGPEWMDIYNETISLLRQFYNTSNDLFIVPGPASALVDMALGSLVESGGQVLIGANGFFGDRMVEIAQGYGIDVVPLTAPLGSPLDPELLRKALRENPQVQVVGFVHHETGTTVMNPLRELAAVAQEAGKVVVADAVSSLGGVEIQTDDWGIDVCITSANKCLEAIPGISFLSVSPRAWELVERNPHKRHGWYLSLATWRKYATEWGSWHPSPVTVSSNAVLAVLTSMRQIVKGGITAHFAKYARASQIVRRGLEELGFDMFVPEPYASPIVTGVRTRPEFSANELGAWLVEERGLAIGGAFGPLAGKIFRVGHLGKAAEDEYLDELLQAVREYLQIKRVAF